MENSSRSHDLGIMTNAHNHNTSKNSLGNKLKHAVVSHGGNSLSTFHRGVLDYFRVNSDYGFVVNPQIGLQRFDLMRIPFQ